MATYTELLKHPEWQRRRLEVFQRENFTCQECGAKDITLHVHHGYYTRGAAPWEYPDDALHCLCENCHARIQRLTENIHQIIGTMSGYQLSAVYGFALGFTMLHHRNPEAQVSIPDGDTAGGLAAFWKIDERTLWERASATRTLTVRDVVNLAVVAHEQKGGVN